MHYRRAIGSALAAAAVILALAGCGATSVSATAPSPPMEPTPTAAATVPPIDGEITDAHICGQVSALATMTSFARWRHDNAELSDADFATIEVAVADGWQNLLTTNSAVGLAARSAQKKLGEVVAAGGAGYVATADDLGNAASSLGQACTEVGSQIALRGTPGSG